MSGSVSRQLDCFSCCKYVGGIQTSIWLSVFALISRRIWGSYSNSVFNFLRNCCVSHSNHIILHSQRQCLRILVSPRSCQHLLFSVLLIIYILIVVIVLICISLMISNIEHLHIFSCAYGHLCGFFFFFEKCLSILSPFFFFFFLLLLCSFFNWVLTVVVEL